MKRCHQTARAPGAGVGGHCIPVDPYKLAAETRDYDFHVRFIELAATVNSNMPYHVVSISREGLGGYGDLPLTEETLSAVDCVIIATDHTTVDSVCVARHDLLLIDTRKVLRRWHKPNVVTR